MTETEKNFWESWAQPVAVPALIFFRLYYNNDGSPICYSMEDLPGNYIDIDAATYQLSPRQVKVVNGALTNIAPKKLLTKLVPGIIGTPCSPDNVSIVTTQQQQHTKWRLKTHESD